MCSGMVKPEMFKMGYIIPINRSKGNLYMTKNSYRRITITYLIGKVLENGGWFTW